MLARTTKYSPKIIARIVEAIDHGLNQRQAANLVGITEQTLTNWKKSHTNLLNKLEATRESAIERKLRTIEKAGERSWQAEAWLLERLHPESYSPKLIQDITTNQPVIFNIDMQGTYKPLTEADRALPSLKTVEPKQIS